MICKCVFIGGKSDTKFVKRRSSLHMDFVLFYHQPPQYLSHLEYTLSYLPSNPNCLSAQIPPTLYQPFLIAPNRRQLADITFLMSLLLFYVVVTLFLLVIHVLSLSLQLDCELPKGKPPLLLRFCSLSGTDQNGLYIIDAQ